jgi:anti-sigma factor RsiW
MAQIYTENQIINLIYGESDLFERLETEFALEDNENLAHRYKQWSQMKTNLEKVRFAPSSLCLDKILTYSGRSVVAC